MGTDIRASHERPKEQKGTAYRIFRLLAWVNGLAAIGLAMLLALPSFIDWSDYKEKIARFGADTYGLDIKIEGAVYAQFLPTPVFRLNRVTISKTGDGRANPLLIKRADVELAFLPLLNGAIEPRAFMLHKPDFVFGLTEDNVLTMPTGFGAIFLGRNSGSITRFGVQQAGFYRRSSNLVTEPLLQDINLIAEKSLGSENWSLQGYFFGNHLRHNFQITTRGRPEKSTTYIDAQIKNTGQEVLTHSFNGSVSERGGAVELQGRYQSVGRVEQLGQLYALNVRSKIKLSQTDLNISGFTLNAAPVQNKEKTHAQKPVIVNLDMTAQKNEVSDKWQLESNIYAENIDWQLFSSTLSDEQGRPGGMGAITQLNALAKLMDGQVSFSAINARLNKHIFPRIYGQVLFEQDLMHFADTGALLPGGGKLQTERLTAKLTNNKNELLYKGAVYVKASQVQDIAALLPIGRSFSALPSLSHSSNDISMSGILHLSRSGLSFKSDNLLVNDASGRAAFSIRKGRDLRREIFLNLEKVNLDRLLRAEDKNFIDLIAAFATQEHNTAKGDGVESINKFDISINKLLWRGTSLTDISTQGQISSDDISLANFSIGGKDDESFQVTMRGKVSSLSSSPQGQFDLSLNSLQTIDVLSLIAPKFLFSEKGKELVRRAEMINPLQVKARIFSTPETGKTWSLDLEGHLASTEFSSEGQFEPIFSQAGFSPQAVDVQFELSNPSSRLLAAQLFSLSLDELKVIPETEGYMRASVSGSGETGFDVALGGEVSDLQLTLGGTAKRAGDNTSLAAQIKLYSPKSVALSRFTGVPLTGDFGKTEYVANIAGSGDQYVISGGRGQIAGQSVNLEANLDLTGEKPLLTAQVDTKHIGPRSLKSAFAILMEPGGGVRELTSYIDTRLTVSTPFMRFGEGVDISNAKTQITLTEDRAVLDAMEGGFYGGILVVKGEAQKRGVRTDLSARYELKGAELERVLVQENLEKIAKGKFTLAGELSASTANLTNIAKSLTGRGYIKAGEGELRGLNPAAFGRAVRFVSNGTELDGMIGGILSEGAIPFSQFQTAFTIKDGIVQSDKTQLISREVRAQNITRINLQNAKIASDWTFTLSRLPKTPAIKLQYAGRPHQLSRRLESGKLRTYLMALMRKGESLSTRFAAKTLPAQRADDIQTGSIKRTIMKKPLQLEGLKILPRANPLRVSQ